MREIKDYLIYEGEQYRSPEKAGDAKDRMLSLRKKGQVARKTFTQIAKLFQEMHSDWNLHPTSQWMNQAQRLRPHFWAYLQADGSVSEPMLALRLYGNANNFGISLEVSFIERKRDENSLMKQAKVLTIPVTQGVYYWVQENGESYRIEATEENRNFLQSQLDSRRIRKVLVKTDVPISSETSIEVLLVDLEKAYQRLLPYYQATRN